MQILQPYYTRRAFVAAFAIALPLVAGSAGSNVRGIRGIPNFHGVNDQIYRGGQPTDEGFRSLAAAGFKTIVDLREDDRRSKQEKHLVHSLGMHYVNIPMKGMKTPSDKSVAHALKVLNDENRGPVFIHCRRGADRTGVVLACYRMEHDGWSNRQALQEASSLGMSWYQFPLQRYVANYRPHNSHGPVEAVRDFGGDTVDTLKDLPRKAAEIFRK